MSASNLMVGKQSGGALSPVKVDVNGKLVSGPGVRVLTATLTLDTAAYATGDTLGDIAEVTGVVDAAGDGAVLSEVTVIDADDQGAAFDVVIFDRTFTLTGAKNAAWGVSDADMLNCQGIVSVGASDYVDCGLNRVATKGNLSIGVKPNGTSLFLGTISRGSGTYTANGLKLKLTFLV